MKRLISRWLTLLLIIGTLTACHPWIPSPPTPRPPRVIRVVGSSDLAPVVKQAEERAREVEPTWHLVYTPTNTTTGLRLLRQGRGDVALASWLSQRPGDGLSVYSLGMDAIAVIVHPGVGVEALDRRTLQRLFEGRYLRWARVGGNDVPIRLVSREEGSGTRMAFETLMMEGHPVALTAVVMPSAQDVVRYVARHEGAIGYVSIRLVHQGVDVLAIDGHLPTKEAIERGQYPLVRETYAVFRPTARDVVDLFVGSDGREP